MTTQTPLINSTACDMNYKIELTTPLNSKQNLSANANVPLTRLINEDKKPSIVKKLKRDMLNKTPSIAAKKNPDGKKLLINEIPKTTTTTTPIWGSGHFSR